MGRMKELWMEEQERGWCSVGDHCVCPCCVSDAAIKGFIKQNVAEKKCYYCGRVAKGNIAARMDEVIKFIADAISTEYEPAEGGGYMLKVFETVYLLSNLGLNDSHEQVFEDLCKAFSHRDWVYTDPYGDRECDALRYNWESFADQVKHHTRFVFFRLSTADKEAGEPEPHEILGSLHRIVTEVGFVRTLDQNSPFFRAHQHDQGECLTGAKRLGTPPPELASHGRMSPAGIPMLYAAREAQTAEAEVISSYPATVTTAEFTNLRTLRILDLSQIPDEPSLFDERMRHQRMPLIFLKTFAKEISKTISEDESPYEYVPTQIMTEYFRHLFHLPSKKNPIAVPPLDGIAFRSSKNKGGINYTLFLDQKACADAPTEKTAVMLLRGIMQQTIAEKPESMEEAIKRVLSKGS